MSIYQLMAHLWFETEWAVLKGPKQGAYEMNQMLMRLRCERIKCEKYVPGRFYSLRS